MGTANLVAEKIKAADQAVSIAKVQICYQWKLYQKNFSHANTLEMQI